MKLKLAAAVAALGLLAACGNDADTTARTTPSPSPTGPQRIVSLSASATEMLFAIGAGAQVVAVDSTSNYPPTAPKTDLSAYEPSAEAISKHQPDLVVIDTDAKNIKSQLEKLSIPVVVEPAAKTLDETYAQIADLGDKTGHRAQADTLVASMKEQIGKLVQGLPTRAKPLTYFHELDNTLYSVTSKTFIGAIYTLAGLSNIADPADKDAGGYPQLSAEYIVEQDPDLVFLADTKCCQQTATTFAARPGFSKLQAVKENHVVLLDDDIASRWGPRVVDLLTTIVGVVKGIPSS